jgi:hypothetical protein
MAAYCFSHNSSNSGPFPFKINLNDAYLPDVLSPNNLLGVAGAGLPNKIKLRPMRRRTVCILIFAVEK